MTTEYLSDNAINRRLIVDQVIINDDIADGTETALGYTVRSGCVLEDVYIYVDTEDAGITIDIGTQGTSNDPDGFLDGVSLATAGLVKGTLLSSGQTRGLLLAVDESGGGVLVPEGCTSAGGDAVSYTASAGSTARFSIFFVYTKLV